MHVIYFFHIIYAFEALWIDMNMYMFTIGRIKMSWIEKISNWQTNQKIAITSDLVIIAWLVTNSLVDLINELSDQVTCLTPVIQSSACPREVDRLRVWGTCLFLSFGLHTQCCVSSLHQFDLSFVKYTFGNHVEIISDDDRYQMSQRSSQNGFIFVVVI